MLSPPLFLILREIRKKFFFICIRKSFYVFTPLFDMLRLGCIAPHKYWAIFSHTAQEKYFCAYILTRVVPWLMSLSKKIFFSWGKISADELAAKKGGGT